MSEQTSSAVIEQAASLAASVAPELVTAAVAASQAAAAPADPLEQRLQAIETTVATYAPVLQMVQSMIGAAVPGAAPVVNRLTELEQWAAAIVAHLGSKAPAAPGG